MTLLAFGAIVGALAGAVGAIAYSVGQRHGRENAVSERWDALQQRRYRRCTPEPTRLRLLADPFHAVTPDMPEPVRSNLQALNDEIAKGMASWRPPYDPRHPVFFDQDDTA